MTVTTANYSTSSAFQPTQGGDTNDIVCFQGNVRGTQSVLEVTPWLDRGPVAVELMPPNLLGRVPAAARFQNRDEETYWMAACGSCILSTRPGWLACRHHN